MFLFSKKEMVDWNVVLHKDKNMMDLKKDNRKIDLENSVRGHDFIRLEKIG